MNIKYLKKNKIYFIIISLLLINNNLFAQKKINIRGQIIDTLDKSYLKYATIRLFNENNLIVGAITDSLGKFRLVKKTKGEIKQLSLKINFLGYEQKTLFLKKSRINLGIIYLQPNMNILKKVTIIGERNKRKDLINKTIIYPDSTILKASTNALNYMKKLTDVFVDNISKTISITGNQGKATIYINDVLADGITDLRSINSKDIDHIEIIKNASIKYGSETKGIINVILKKRTQGYNINVSLDYSTHFRDINPYINMRYTRKKISCFIYYCLPLGRTISTSSNITEYNKISDFNKVETSEKYNIFKHSNQLKYGFDIFINKNNLFNFTVRTKWFFNNSNGNINYQTYINNINANSISHTYKGEGNAVNQNYSIFYKHQFNSKSDFILNYNFYFFKFNFIDNYFNRREITDNKKKSHFLRINYSYNINKKISFESGYNFYNRALNNDFENSQSNINLKFFELRNSFYSKIYFKLFQKTSFNIGIRYENSYIKLYNNQSKNMNSILPEFGIKYKINEKHNIVFSINKELNYPYYSQLEPFPFYDSDSLSYTIGNINLLPEKLFNYKLKYNFFHSNNFYFSAILHINPTKEIISSVKTAENNNVIRNTYENISLSCDKGISLYLTFKPKPYFWINTFTDFSHYLIKKDSTSNNGNRFTFNFVTGINFSKTLSLVSILMIQPSSFYVNGYTESRAFIPNNISLTKQLFKQKASITLGWAFPFKDFYSKSHYKDNNFNMYDEEGYTFQCVYINFTYSFFKGEKKEINAKSYLENDSEK